MIGTRQVTLSVSKQLDRLEYDGYCCDAIPPFGRVKTGVRVELERAKKGSTRDELGIPTQWETYTDLPYLEIIGRSNREGDRRALVIYEIARRCDVAEDDKATLAE